LKVAAGADDADGDFAAVRDQNLLQSSKSLAVR
jgi:hypothetical protein